MGAGTGGAAEGGRGVDGPPRGERPSGGWLAEPGCRPGWAEEAVEDGQGERPADGGDVDGLAGEAGPRR